MIEITHEPLDPEAITAMVKNDSNGAVVTFLGTTRSFTENRKVLHLEYEAYRPMADAKLQEIADDIRSRWEIEDVAIAHRRQPLSGRLGQRRYSLYCDYRVGQPGQDRGLIAASRTHL